MVLDKFNMVDMEGIDLIESQGVEVPGLYQKLVESIAQCRYQCLYNWKFDGIIIPPTYVEMAATDESVSINGGVSVDLDDIVHIDSLSTAPVIEPLSVRANGVYTPEEGVDGYSPVTVAVEAPLPVIEPLSVTANGVYTPEEGVDGYSPVTVNIPAVGGLFEKIEPIHYDYVGGFIAGGIWNTGDNSARTDIYTVEAGKTYLVNLGSIVGNRFRATIFPSDPAEGIAITNGTNLIMQNDPVPYQVITPMFTPSSNGFLAIQKTSQSLNGLKTYVAVFNEN